MRAVILFFLINSFCNRFGFSEEQTNFETPSKKSTYANINNKANSLGEREYYIPSHSQLQRQEFIYPNNFRNAYQYSQYKYTNRVPAIVNQRQWPLAPTLRNSIYRDYPYKSSSGETTDDVSNEYNRDPINNAESRNEKSNSQKINNNNSKLKTNIRINDKTKEFSEDQKMFTNIEGITGSEYKDQNNNKLRNFMISPVTRRKSTTNDNSIHTSALQSSEQRSIPIPLARQQSSDSLESPNGSLGDIYFVAIVACVSAVAIFGVIGAGYCVYKVQQSNKAAADVDYPAYGVVGPASKDTNATGNLSPSGDRKLAQSAQMYHYHHQKQQMIASEKAVTPRHTSASDVESDEENEEGEYTVYECPGLAPTGEMEVKNPLFHDDITPVSSPPVTANNKEK